MKDVHVVTWLCVRRPVYSKAVGKLKSINHDIIAAHFSMSMIVHHCNAPRKGFGDPRSKPGRCQRTENEMLLELWLAIV